MEDKIMQYSLNEVCLLPSKQPTDIISRSQVDPHDSMQYLPIFVAPMTSIVNGDNYTKFDFHRVIPIIPRGVKTEIPFGWKAYSLSEIEEGIKNQIFSNFSYVLIDVANGHMQKIYDLSIQLKQKWPDITIMVGNIAHPEMYKACIKADVDYVRVGIGGGSVCTTSVQTGIHASHVWMIQQIKIIQGDYLALDPKIKLPKLIADGGINSIDKAIKCLAIGYDYVMMGSCFAKCREACGQTSSDGFHRNYYGMASEQGQLDISGGVCKNPEGVAKWLKIDTNLKEFTSKFEAALRSAMSYTGAHNLKEFRNTNWDIMSLEEFKSYYK